MEIARKVNALHRKLLKKQQQILALEQKSKLSEEEQEKVNTKVFNDALLLEVKKLLNLHIVPPNAPPNEQTEPSPPKRKLKQKMKREVKAVVKELDKEADDFSYSGILSKSTEDKALMAFKNFFTEFTLHGESKSVCCGIAKSMIVCYANTMVIKYAHLEAHNKEMAMMICNMSTKLMPKLTAAASEFLYQTWADDLKSVSSEDLDPVKEMMKKFNIQIEGLPQSHMTLKSYMKQQPKAQWRVLDKMEFYRPTSSTNQMISGILAEMIGNHKKGLAWNGELSVDDVEVKNGSIFIISKRPIYQFDPELISKQVAGWFKQDFNFVWDSVCMKVVSEAGNDMHNLPHYPMLCMKLTKTPSYVFCNSVKLKAFHELMLHFPATKPAFERSIFVSGVQTCCRSYDMEDPAAPYKTLLFRKNMSGSIWSKRIRESGSAVLKGVFNYYQEDDDEAAPENGPPEIHIAPDGQRFQSRRLYMHHIQTNSHHRNGPTLGSFVDYSRHTSNHGTKYSKERLDFVRCPQDHTGVQYYVPRGNQAYRHRKVDDLGIFEEATALQVGEALTEMISLLLENNAMVGMLEPFWKRYKSCGS